MRTDGQTERQTYGQDEANSRFSQCWKPPKKTPKKRELLVSRKHISWDKKR